MADLLEHAREKKRELDRLLRKAERLQSPERTERQRDTERKRAGRLLVREVQIPPCANRRRRKRYESVDKDWLRFYFGEGSGCPDPFWYKFTSQQLEMIAAIRSAILHGGDQSLAASRGEGKTTLFERMLLKYTLQGVVGFSVLCASTGTAAANSLESIRDAIETNDRLLADYPEACVPVRALENTPNRAHYQVVTGRRHDNREAYKQYPSRFSWCGQEIVFPDVPGAPSRKAIIATRGLDAAIRGLKRKGRRPQVVGIDDPDTEDTARSEDQADKLEDRIDRAIGGLGGQQRGIARVMLTTIQNRICVSYRYTDPEKKPSWKGRRFRFLVKPPDRQDMWDDYVQRRQADQQSRDDEGNFLDPHARQSHQFYLDNRKAMDAGAVVANPNRYDPEKLPDGSQCEVSALQRYHNEIAKIGAEAVAAEYDNDPPVESGPVESGITAERIQRQVSGYPRFVVPPGCTVLTQGIDVGKYALHYVVKAWRPDATGFVIDYGIEEVHGTSPGNDEATDRAILRALYARREAMLAEPYTTADGEILEVTRTVIDASYRTSVVYHFCREIGLGFHPAMGQGKSNGCTQANFRPPVRSTSDRRPGDGWFEQRQPKGIWLLNMDTDRWKSWEHDRWMSPPDGPGTCLLWGERSDDKRPSKDQQGHFRFSKHLTAEIEIEEPTRDRGIVRRWRPPRGANHYFDASYMANVAANMSGISLLKSSQPKQQHTGGWFAAQQKRR